MNLDRIKPQVKCLIELVSSYRYCISELAPEGWQKEYLLTMCKSIVNLQRCVLKFDTYQTILRYLPFERYKLAVRALKYDAFADFRKSVAQHEDLVNDTFLFVE